MVSNSASGASSTSPVYLVSSYVVTQRQRKSTSLNISLFPFSTEERVMGNSPRHPAVLHSCDTMARTVFCKKI